MSKENKPRFTPEGANNVTVKLLEHALANSSEAQKMINSEKGAKSLGANLAIAYLALFDKLTREEGE